MNLPSVARLSLVAAPLLLLLSAAFAQDTDSKPADAAPAAKMSLKIVPVVALKPGEEKELLLSTHCTVGATRGGGFALAEMRDGKPIAGPIEGFNGASYTRDGVAIKIPGWAAAEKFAREPQFAALASQHIQAFTVSVTASADARPGLLEIHLVDDTCSGDCQADFRVLVLPP